MSHAFTQKYQSALTPLHCQLTHISHIFIINNTASTLLSPGFPHLTPSSPPPPRRYHQHLAHQYDTRYNSHKSSYILRGEEVPASTNLTNFTTCGTFDMKQSQTIISHQVLIGPQPHHYKQFRKRYITQNTQTQISVKDETRIIITPRCGGNTPCNTACVCVSMRVYLRARVCVSICTCVCMYDVDSVHCIHSGFHHWYVVCWEIKKIPAHWDR